MDIVITLIVLIGLPLVVELLGIRDILRVVALCSIGIMYGYWARELINTVHAIILTIISILLIFIFKWYWLSTFIISTWIALLIKKEIKPNEP